MPDAERSPHTHGVAASFFCVTSSNGLLFPGSMFFECYGRRVNSPLAGRDLDRLFGSRRFEPDPPHHYLSRKTVPSSLRAQVKAPAF